MVAAKSSSGKHPPIRLSEFDAKAARQAAHGHSNPPFRGSDFYIGAVLSWLYRLKFRGARLVISVSAELGDILVKTVRLDPSSVVTIANSIDLEAASKRAAEAPGHPWFAGRQSNPLKFLAHAELFVLSSNWEGMSNVLLEAMVCGCPILATDCPTGVRELLEGGRIGAIVPVGNVDAMVQAIVTKLSEMPNRKSLRREAARYDRKQAMNCYVAILREEMAQAKLLEEQSNSK